jgi:hypothetical protein
MVVRNRSMSAARSPNPAIEGQMSYSAISAIPTSAAATPTA